VATRTQNGEFGQGGTPTRDDHARQNQNPPLLEIGKWLQQMEDLGQTQPTK
jgi:hypothetical protein